MSTAEITAYLYGAERARAGVPISLVLPAPSGLQMIIKGCDVGAAQVRLGAKMFDYWVRRGYEEGLQWQG